jgi:hypothetical protein
MSKTNNTRSRSEAIQAIAQSLVNQELHDNLPLAASKPLRVVWQHQLRERTGCTTFTARVHIAKALRRLRYINHIADRTG